MQTRFIQDNGQGIGLCDTLDRALYCCHGVQLRARSARRQALSVGLALGLGITGISGQAQPPPTPVKPGTQTSKPVPPAKSAGAAPSLNPSPAGSSLLGLPAPVSSGPTLPAPLAKLTPEEWARKGRAAMSARNFADAITAFQQVVLQQPKGAGGWFSLGVAYDAAKRYAEAAQSFRTMSQLTPSDPQPYALLANALSQANRTDEALLALSRAVELSPGTTQYQLLRGEMLMQQKEYKQAQTAYLQALGTAPDDPRVHLGLGDANEQDGQHLAALAEYDAALNIEPADLSARMGRATALASLGRMTEAEALITRTEKELDSAYSRLHTQQATGLGDAQAQTQLQAQIAGLTAQIAGLHSAYAQILDSAQRREDAIREYQAALQITGDSATTWGNLGWTQYEAGQYEAAIQSSRKALTLDGGLAYVRLNLGLVYAVQDKWALAEPEYRAALAVATHADLEAGVSDARAAIGKQPASRALLQALAYLTQAASKAAH